MPSAAPAIIAAQSDVAATHLVAAPYTHDFDDDDSRPLDNDDPDDDEELLLASPLAVALPVTHCVRYRSLHASLHVPPDSDELLRPPQPRVD